MQTYSASPWDQVRAYVFDDAPGNRHVAGRTVRAFARCGVPLENLSGATPPRLAEIIPQSTGPILLVRAGTWPVDGKRFLPPPPSATGMPLCALGAVQPEPAFRAVHHESVAHWAALHARTGGNFAHQDDFAGRLPPVAIAYLETPLVAPLAARLAEGELPDGALRAELCSAGRRVVRYAPLDVHFDPALRIVQLVTSLQQGGAERIALDLHRTLAQCGVHSLLVGLGSPTRAAFPVPDEAVDLSRTGPGRPERIAAAAQAALDFAADLVHGHLLHGADVAQLAAFGLPVVLTVHNMPPGWPHDLAKLLSGDAALLVACSQAVEAELRKANIPIPVRTVWNGIDFAVFAQTPELIAAGRTLRRQLGVRSADESTAGGMSPFAPRGPSSFAERKGTLASSSVLSGDFVLLSLANPRPQKRLELLPPILAAAQQELAARGIARRLHLVVAGEPSRIDESAARSESALAAAISACGLADRIHRPGAVEDVASLLAASDALISTSAYEGLSLAHLEALAAGLPVVATDVGGAAEVARQNPAVFLLPANAPPEQFAAVLADIVQHPPAPGRAAAETHFTRYRMAEGYRRLYPRAIEAAGDWSIFRQENVFCEKNFARKHGPVPLPHPNRGLWLVTNNFSMGGAQSSARRLLLGMAARGIRVRAAVLEEQPEYPTPGREALLAAGIPVLALPPAGTIDPAEAVAMLLAHIDADPPAAVMFWNAIAQYKVLLADSLLDLPVFDVSPGEMYFSSLEKYFDAPRPGLPYRSAKEYGSRLSGVIVKFQGEATKAADWLGAPVHVVPNGVPLNDPARSDSVSAADSSVGWVKRSADPPISGKSHGGSSLRLTHPTFRDGDYFEAGSEDRPRGECLILGTAARISPQKKLEELFAALRAADGRMPPYELRIAGGVERGADDYARRLREDAAGLPVAFVGELADPRPFYRRLDLFVMISEPAGCPNASLEAMAAGLAVVATDVGGAAEQVADGVTGRIVPRADTAALADAIVALAADPSLRRSYGTAARARIATAFNVDRMVDDYCRILFSRMV